MNEDREAEFAKLRFSGRKEDWPVWSTQFLAPAQLKSLRMYCWGRKPHQ